MCTDVNYVYAQLMRVKVMRFTALYAQARLYVYKNLLNVCTESGHWTSITWCSLIGIDEWPWQLNVHALSRDMAVGTGGTILC